jgi:hypothetical protein
MTVPASLSFWLNNLILLAKSIHTFQTAKIKESQAVLSEPKNSENFNDTIRKTINMIERRRKKA